MLACSLICSLPANVVVNFFSPAPTVGVIPGEPTDVVVTEATKSYVVLAWKPPVQRGHEGVMYYIEKVVIIFVFFWQVLA